MASLHEDGYTFIGDRAINKLTISEIRVLKEGQYQNDQERKRQRRAKRGSGSDEVSETRMEIERSRDKNDKALVEEMASN